MSHVQSRSGEPSSKRLSSSSPKLLAVRLWVPECLSVVVYVPATLWDGWLCHVFPRSGTSLVPSPIPPSYAVWERDYNVSWALSEFSSRQEYSEATCEGMNCFIDVWPEKRNGILEYCVKLWLSLGWMCKPQESPIAGSQTLSSGRSKKGKEKGLGTKLRPPVVRGLLWKKQQLETQT